MAIPVPPATLKPKYNLMPISATNNSVNSQTAAASHVGYNNSSYITHSGRSRTDAAGCSWKGFYFVSNIGVSHVFYVSQIMVPKFAI